VRSDHVDDVTYHKFSYVQPNPFSDILESNRFSVMGTGKISELAENHDNPTSPQEEHNRGVVVFPQTAHLSSFSRGRYTFLSS